MTALHPDPPPLPDAASYTDDQLHQRACISCGRSDGELLPAGHVETGTGEGRLTWAVSAHPEHQEAAAC